MVMMEEQEGELREKSNGEGKEMGSRERDGE